MPGSEASNDQLRRELEETRARLADAEEALNAIRNGEVDGLVMVGPEGRQVYTLQGAQEPYRLLVEQMSEGALTLSREGVILYANQVLARLLLMPLERVIGAELLNFVRPEDRPVLVSLIEQAWQGSSHGGLSLQTADGSEVPLRLGLSRLQLHREVLICVVATDLTEQNKREEELRRLHAELGRRVEERTAELAASRLAALNLMTDAVEARERAEQISEALRESEASYRTLYREMANAFARSEVICDARGNPIDSRYLEVNPAYERITGMKAEDLVGKRLLEVFPGLEPDWIEVLGRVALTGQPAHVEKAVAPLGIWVDLLVFCPGPNQWACTFTDITKRKQAEEAVLKRKDELERFEKLAVGRELRMKELKLRIVELEQRLEEKKA